ncbi:MAG TPA: RsmD family RNA methyltransferase [Sandaracinaceae bacterium LLY-WYZ-13_1]|nr:RsmD family RNA methyltransferase [Sandaracinaceae bacterium LLY-WYZ-13_1]
MRIVGGTLGGRRFSGPRGDATRPTSERVREALASALEARGWIAGARVLDLWAGTGALSFEALSRGAEHAVLVERDRRVARAIGRSARELGLEARVRVVVSDLEKPPARWIEAAPLAPVGLVFCDPPYARVERVGPLLAELARAGVLRPRAAVVVEHARRSPPSLPAAFGEVATYRYGDTAVWLGTAPEAPEPP